MHALPRWVLILRDSPHLRHQVSKQVADRGTPSLVLLGQHLL